MKLVISSLVFVTLAFSQSAESTLQAGKAVFDTTCKNCHGVKGEGDRMADKFYQVTIPRLNSDYVQQKSDAELSEIITKGRRKMEAVRTGAPSMRHHLEPEHVEEDVILALKSTCQVGPIQSERHQDKKHDDRSGSEEPMRRSCPMGFTRTLGPGVRFEVTGRHRC